ncbi:hypothetical protein KFU94_10235 [Chloroflexi bacterium TSY]|nr:hypothetical protein [Chloroflexi bacterium TSY]
MFRNKQVEHSGNGPGLVSVERVCLVHSWNAVIDVHLVILEQLYNEAVLALYLLDNIGKELE